MVPLLRVAARSALLGLVFATVPAGATVCPSGATLTTVPPDGYAEYQSRFHDGYSTNHLLPKARQHLAKPSSDEIKDSQEERNLIRGAAWRYVEQDGFEGDNAISNRFCGLRYPAACQPENAEGADAQFLAACYDVRPRVPSWCSSTSGTQLQARNKAACDLEVPPGTWVVGDVCRADDEDGKTSFEKYIKSVMPVAVFSIVLAIVFPFLCLVWYLLRCCQCCCGRKPSGYLWANEADRSCFKVFCGWLCPVCCKGDTSLTFKPYSKRHILIFRGSFALFFLLALISGLMALVGNGKLNSGLPDTTDTMMYNLAQKVTDFERIMKTINGIENNSPNDEGTLTGDMAQSLDDFRCFIADAQADISENAPDIFDLRSMAVLAVGAIPIFVTLLGLVAALCSSRILSCCIAYQMGWLVIIVWISFGLHGLLAVVVSDLCLEIDLVLHVPKHEPVDVSFFPGGVLPCGEDSEFAELSTEIEKAARQPLLIGGEMMRDFCNRDSGGRSGQSWDFTALATPVGPGGGRRLVIDCSAAAGPGKLLGVVPGSSPPRYAEGSYTLDNFAEAQRQIVVGDPPLVDRTCRYNGAAEVPGYAQGTCPGMTKSNQQCAPDLLWISSGAGEVRKTMEDCAKLDMGAGGCRLPDLQQMSCQIVDGLNELQKLRKYTELLETEINPLLRCEFVKEIFAGMYMPLCVDAVAGFGRVTAANFLGGWVMLLMIPFATAATKRLDRRSHKVQPGDDGATDLAYKGAVAPDVGGRSRVATVQGP